MSTLQWTKDKPSKTGYYWCRSAQMLSPVIIKFTETENSFRSFEEDYDPDGEWLGPLSPGDATPGDQTTSPLLEPGRRKLQLQLPEQDPIDVLIEAIQKGKLPDYPTQPQQGETK